MLAPTANRLSPTDFSIPAVPDAGHEAQRRLSESPYFALRSLRCDCREGVLTVHGRVPTFYARQIALETVKSVQKVDQVIDRIEVE